MSSLYNYCHDYQSILQALKKNKEINDYLNEHLDIFIQKGELAFVYDNFRVNGLVNILLINSSLCSEVLVVSASISICESLKL